VPTHLCCTARSSLNRARVGSFISHLINADALYRGWTGYARAHEPNALFVAGHLFSTSDGSIEILIEEMQEIPNCGPGFSFVGRVVTGARTGARATGQYDGQTKIGRLHIKANGG